MGNGRIWGRLAILVSLLALAGGAWWLWGSDYAAVGRAIRQLNGDDAARAEQAAQYLAENQTPRALVALVEGTRSRHPAAAVQSLAGLARARQAQYLPVVQAALSDSRQEVRVAAITALGTIDAPVEAAPLVALLGPAEPPVVRAAAARCLGSRRMIEAIPDLVRSMRDPASEVRAAAYGAIAHMSDRNYRFDPDGPPAERERIIRLIDSTTRTPSR